MYLEKKRVTAQKRNRISPGNRRYERAVVEGYKGEIAYGNQVISGVVNEVSPAGLRISQLPEDFSINRRHYIAVVSGYKKQFKIIIRPRWFKTIEDSDSLDVGFSIVDAPWEWLEFISKTIPEFIN